MEIEPITFGLGLNLRNSPLYLKDGELVSCEGFDFANVGVMDARGSKQAVNDIPIGSIHSIHRYRNHVLLGDGGNLRYKWDLDGYCNNYVPPDGNFTYLGNLASSNKWRTADYAGFTFIAMQGDLYAFQNGYYYNCAQIKSPDTSPSVVSTGGSGSAADHTWYYTYVYRFPNGHQYETGLSPGRVVSSTPTGQSASVIAYNTTIYPMSGTIPVNGGIDAYAVAAYHFDGADESTTITDSSTGGSHTGTCVNAKLDTAQKKFGSASLILGGTGGYVTIGDSADFTFGAGDFTIDFWVRLSSLPSASDYYTFYSQYQNDSNCCYFALLNNLGNYYLIFEYKDGGTTRANFLTAPITLSSGEWYHVALVRSGSSQFVFINGISQTLNVSTAFGSNSLGDIAADVQVGAYNSALELAGWLDELRISKGVARWTADFTVPSVAYSGDSTVSVQENADGVDVFWKAYKTADAIGGIYECYNGINKYTLSATDAYDDSTVLDNAPCTSDNYGPWPSGIKDVCVHLQRLFGIKENKLYWSEPYLPFAVDAANYLAITPDGEDLTSLVQYGTQVFVSSASTWYRLTGTTSATWTVQETFAEVGTINRHTVKKTPYGIIGLWHDGIWMFDGLRTKNITDAKIGQKFFDDISDKDSCFAEFHNNKYYFYYPTTGTTCDKCLMIDFSNAQDLKFYHDNFVPNAFEFHVPTGIKYCGDTDGYQYEDGGSEVISTALQTGDKSMKAVMKRKQLQYLFYDVHTGGKNLTVSVYVDGTNSYSFTLNNSSRTRDRRLLPKLEGYRFSVSLSCADSSGLSVYEPWGFGYTLVGE